LIDLHTHTDASDGTYPPAQLVREAVDLGLEALAICDHDTFDGYDAAAPVARQVGLDLVCGIEISTKLRGRSIHLLGYFLDQPPAPEFCEWIRFMQQSRRDRNIRLVARLRSLGIEVTIEEVVARGRSMAGRPHFAQIMVEKGYVKDIRQAFDDYLDESAKGYVDREEPQFEDAVRRIAAAGGLASLAHPIRVEHEVISEMIGMGLPAIEVYHSDHGPAEESLFLSLAEKYGLAVTGGSDFHGATKPKVRLGGVNIPREVLDKLRENHGCLRRI
jgi:predicted metal-dependent phosphoesterase TrpH